MASRCKLHRLFSIGRFDVWRVDGAVVRRDLHPDFTNWAQPLRFPELIPPHEIWVDIEAAGSELPFYLTAALVEHAAMTRGLDYEDALRLGELAEKKERDKRCPRRFTSRVDFSKLYRRQLGTTSRGLKVWVVSGRYVRDHLFTQFTEGGHGLVFDFIPHDEVWIDDALVPAERPFVLRHELVEREYMAARGMSYPRAHLIALRYEHEARVRSGPGRT